jgi:upstream activation factor subunit UAF30
MASKKKGGKKKAAKKAGKKKAAPKKAAKKKAAKKAKPAKKAKRKGTGRKPGPGLTAPMQPDETLAAVIGDRAIPRTEVTKKIWEYIRKNGLQDEKNRRQINADDKLKALFGGKKNVTMFELTKHVSNHMKPA